MSLWPHQSRAIELARDAMRTVRRVVLQVPTGGGKTKLAVEVARSALSRGRKVLWLAHRTELITQAVRELAELQPGCIAASSDLPARPDAPLQVASIQTLLARESPPADLVVVDECHHMGEGAGEWTKLLARYPLAYVLGLTATPERGDGTGLAPMFERLIQVVSVRELTMAGHLVPCEVVRPGRYLRERGATGNKLAKDPVDAWLEHAGARSGFIFAASVEEAQEYAERLNGLGIVARCVHAKTPADERAAIVEGFRRGTVTVLTNVYVFTEGTDLPQASCCVLARGCSTAGMYLQIVGRVLRSAPGKTDALLVDLPGVSHLHGMPEDERVWRLDGRASSVAGLLCRVCGKPLEAYPCPSCGYEADAGDAPTSGTEIVNERLEVVKRLLAHSPEQQRGTLKRWLVEAAYKGHSSGTVVRRWNRLYPAKLDWSWYATALMELRSDTNTRIAEWAREQVKRHRDRRANA